MQRIAIIGCGGSGKSTLAMELGRRLGLPVHHLDRHYWKPGWIETPADEWVSIQEPLIAQPAWIIDGNYGGTLDLRIAACDTVIFLDLPTRVCLWGAFRRLLKYLGKTRPDMTEGCPEQFTMEYLFWILTYRSKRRPKILHKLGELGTDKRTVVLRSRQSVRDFLRDKRLGT